ncbi:peptidylprolyl isomerase [Ignavibacterium sp.]|uniref:peptidylprolyl isomerase n=1 Tax=Ignavibacterium sp. TaxID=2651167 RepID=UPI00307E57C7
MGNFYLNIIKIFSLIFFAISNFSIGQFKPDYYDLIESTAKRQFDKTVIEKYLNSSDSSQVIAALLSFSHSEDTTFIKQLTELDFRKYGKWISFTLGQIGKSEISKKYLWQNLFDSSCKCSEYIFYALGKLGDESDLQRLNDLYFNRNLPKSFFNGIEDAILQFRNRNIKSELSKKILVEEISDNSISVNRKKKALFTLARLGSDSTINPRLLEILSTSNDDELLQLLLMNFRIQKYFPADQKLLSELNSKSDAVRIEFIKVLPYSEYKSSVISIIKSILNSENENLIIEGLRSLQVNKWDSDLLNDYRIKNTLIEIIKESTNKIIIEEAFNAYKYLFGIDDNLNSGSLNSKLTTRTRLQLLFDQQKDNLKFDEVEKLYSETEDLKERSSALEFILSESKVFPNDSLFNNFVSNSLLSNNAAIISTAADGLDSSFVKRNSDKLKTIILEQTNRFKNNTDFIEAKFSLINLSKKISDSFYKEVISNLSDTKVYALKKFLNKESTNKEIVSKEFPNLDSLLKKSFEYSGAIIKTNKGNIEIKFRADLVPVTVGNFISLAEKYFYNGINFHRVVPGFVIQTGDPTGTGWGGPGYEIISEFSPEEFFTGAVGMASAGKDTEGSQFFIMQGYYPHLNGRYTLFAEVTAGRNLVMNIAEGDIIISVQLIK